MIDFYNGEQGIRTLEALVALTHFPGVLLRPDSDSSPQY